MGFAAKVASKVAAGLDVDPDHVAAAIVAAMKSFYVTGYAMFVGLTCDAYAQGYRSLDGFEQYARNHWLAWCIANVLAPAWRATAAYRNAANNKPPPDEPQEAEQPIPFKPAA